jgi:Tfp pilus assembly protein PilN
VIGVNLIPQSLRDARRHRRLVVGWTLSGGIYALALVLGCVVARSLYLADTHALDQQTGDMIHRIATADQNSRSLKSQLAELQAQSQTAHAIADQPDWSLLLGALAGTMDDELTLRDVRIAPITDKKTTVADPLTEPREYSLTIRGLGANSTAISKFVSHLEETKFFDEVKLTHTGREPFMTGMAVSFDLECSFGSATASSAAAPGRRK